MTDIHTTSQFIPTVIANGRCGKHGVDRGMPCYSLITTAGQALDGVCNQRARRAGFVGQISDASIRTRRGEKA